MDITIHQLGHNVDVIKSVQRIRLATEKGRVELLPGHESLFAVVASPELSYQKEEGAWETQPLPKGGFLTLEEDHVNLWVL